MIAVLADHYSDVLAVAGYVLAVIMLFWLTTRKERDHDHD